MDAEHDMQGGTSLDTMRRSPFRGQLSRGTAVVADRRQGYAATPHTHDCDMLFLPAAGRFDVLDARERHLRMGPGSFVWFAADAAHATAAQTHRQTHLALYIDPDLWSTALRAQGASGAEQGLRRASVALNAMVHRIVEMSLSEPERDPTAYCGALVMEAARLCAGRVQQPCPTQPSQDLTLLLLDHIERDLSQALAMDEFARRQRISRRQLERVFREHAGCSPLEYQQRKRLERARELLVSTRDSVLDIAQQVGWESASHLGRMLRSAWGVTATELRASTAQRRR